MSTGLETFRAVHGDPATWSEREFEQWLTESDICRDSARKAAEAAAEATRRACEATAALNRVTAARARIGGIR
ncbi:hypothetical protein [Streptomyces sp. NPDC087300]|uniref:hypothetical protein n=1 Tax=Streptomyces sp. NPDC087300 TaxID=3365780 RepID=UPI003823B4E7